MKRLPGILVVALLAGGYQYFRDRPNNDSHGYPKHARSSFVKACKSVPGADGTTSRCDCIFDKIEEHYTYGELKALALGQGANSTSLPAEDQALFRSFDEACS